MSLLQRMFGRPGASPAAATSKPSQSGAQAPAASTRGGASSTQSVRKELVRVSTRDMLLHNGIPADWVRADPLTTAVAGRPPGVHVRLSVLHWDPRLMVHAVALQQNVLKRIQTLDPQADQWLMGVSWQFALKDESACPPLPHPGSWTAVEEPDSTAGAPLTRPGGSADVISGPTVIATPSPGDARRELERLLSERDADFARRGEDGTGFEKTQPLKL